MSEEPQQLVETAPPGSPRRKGWRGPLPPGKKIDPVTGELVRAGIEKGAERAVTKEIREICRGLSLGNPKVVEKLAKMFENMTVHPLIFKTVLEYAYGKVKFEVEVTTPDSPIRAMAEAMGRALTKREIELQYALDRKMLAAENVQVVDAKPVRKKPRAKPKKKPEPPAAA